MKGKYRVSVQNKKIKYDFEIRRNITIIRGDSATGKTTLIDMIREYDENGEDSGIELVCEKTCSVLEGRNWKERLSLMENSILFIDEGNAFVASKDFAKEIHNSTNYYVIVTRESLPALPYSVNEIYGIKNSGKYGHLKQTYNEMYNIYNMDSLKSDLKPEVVITEDSNSGYQFFENVCKEHNLECHSAYGKSNIFHMLEEQKQKEILVIAAGAAFGPEMEKVMRLVQIKKNIALYLPESFEWIILKTDIIKDSELKDILREPWIFIDSEKHASWERFFTTILTERTENTYLRYNKKNLNPVYLHDNIKNKILNIVDQIQFS